LKKAMAKKIGISPTLLVGTWEELSKESTTVTYRIAKEKNFVVSGWDTCDEEELQITHVRWNGTSLRFTSYCPSTRWRVKHIFTVTERGKAEHVLVTPDGKLVERWIKKPNARNPKKRE
jgi:hypothetical protein